MLDARGFDGKGRGNGKASNKAIFPSFIFSCSCCQTEYNHVRWGVEINTISQCGPVEAASLPATRMKRKDKALQKEFV